LTLDFFFDFWYTTGVESSYCATAYSRVDPHGHPDACRVYIYELGERVMKSREVVITNASGLHARPATFFIQKANCYKCTLWVEKDDRKVNAKSLLGVLSLGIAKGMTVTLIADGQDEDAALDGLTALINSGFAE
jgi:phosphocarrier protein